jgi:SARP family transcriptional regulator, regulator of embCAB operon
MDCRVLGQMTVRSGGTLASLTAPKPRKVLALLMVRANLVVPIETLGRELWRDEPPASAQTTLQTYVLQVRRMLAQTLGITSEEVARDILVTAADGYMLRLKPGELDLHGYQRLAEQGRAAVAERDDALGSRLLGEALALWQDTALIDVRLGPVLTVEVSRLEESRLATWQLRFDAELRLERHHSVLCELSSLAALHPLHEDLQAQYMVALYRSGRRTDALNAFQRLRTTLLEDVGLEPSRRIHQLQRAILTADPALDNFARSAVEQPA